MAETIPKPSSLQINEPVILLVGKTGAGKSTLGNLLLKTSEDETPTFHVSDSFSSVTKKSGSAICKIGGKNYNIVDTPGIFDTDDLTEEILEEISRTIQECAYGIKAILFVFEARRFTNEQKNTLNGITTFLGEESLQYMISVFSHCNKKQTKDPGYFKNSCWNEPIKVFIDSVDNRWAISPNADDFPPDNLVHKQRLKELKKHITNIDGVFTNDLFENARKQQEEIARKAKEEEERLQREYEDQLMSKGEAIAKEYYEKQRKENEKKILEEKKKEISSIKNELLGKIESLTSEIFSLKNPFSNKNDQPSNDNNGCFWPETQVKLESGRIIQMSELQIGDRVLSNIRNGIAEFSDVYLIAHIGKLDNKAKFAKVNFTRPDGSKGQLRLTTTHYVFDENLSIIFAKNLRPGETRILVSDDGNRLVPVFVDNITNEWHDKYISFYTRAGSVIANGVLSSCYDHCPPSQMLMDLVFLPVRWWTYMIPSTHREERLHPYVQFLETAYLSFINAMKKSKRLINK